MLKVKNYIPNSKQWIIAERKSNDLIEQLLLNRGIDIKKKDSFFYPDFEKGLYNPFLLKNINKAIKLIKEAKDKKYIIGIFGDYDTDGVTSTILIQNALDKIGIKSEVYIPSRNEGYGLNRAGIDCLIAKKVNIIIAVDLGITARKEIEYAKKKNIEVVVIDHHLVQNELIPDCIIINPNQKGDKYPNKDLSAGGLVYKFICALQKKFPHYISKNDLKWWLDLTAISTVTDMCPLTDENRVIVYYGIIVIKKTKRIGLKKLIESSAIKPEKINTGSIGFQIGPRLNAAGRIDHATITYLLLRSDNSFEADKIVKKVNQINLDRQKELEKTIIEARKKVINQKLYENKIIMVAQENWSSGIVGLVAGKLMEEFSRPIIALGKQDSVYKGSARSIEKFHLLKAFQHIAELLTSFGGHAKAGGISFKINNFNKVYKKLLSYADRVLQDVDLVSKLVIDAELEDTDLTINFVKKISRFEPYGIGNKKPLFILRSLNIQNIRTIGKDNNHIKLNFEKFDGVLFNSDKYTNLPVNGDTIDIVFTPELNEWQGQEKIDLIIEDWKYNDNKKSKI